jgi:neuronal PAS domain-containing protein 1/3
VISKGQVLTHYYRIMNKNGGYTWIQTCATVVCSAKNADEQNIICVNYVVSGKEGENYIMDQCQLGIKREAYVFPKSESETRTPEVTDDKSKVLPVSPDVGKCDDESTPNKRGRKRKVKNESKDEEISTKCSPTNESNLTELPVKQLENAMTKHLPKLADANTTDFSADSLLRQQSETEKSHGIHDSSSPMPATALLRQLYANRESVIRATTKPTNFMFSENSYLTPPNDSYDSQYLRKSGESFGNFGYTYPSMEYNSAMTPPSSVSPRDLSNQKSSRGSCEYTNLTGDNRGQYTSNESNSLPLPLKPHPYSIHQMDPPYSIDHQSQYFPYHSGFHLYHKSSHVYTPP